MALNKPGYPVRLAQANSRLLSLLQIQLGPDVNPALGENSSSDSMDWVLRLPRTDILKEEDPQVPEPFVSHDGGGGKTGFTGSGSPPIALETGRLPVSGEVNQWYTSSLAGMGGSPQAPGSSGRATTVQVAGDLLGRGDWEVRGLAESLSTEGAALGGFVSDQGANRLRVAMRYKVSPEDSVQVQARFDRDSYRADGESEAFAPSSQAVRTLGYQANWTRNLGKDSGLQVATGFIHAQASVPWDVEAGSGSGERGDELRDWHWNAQAGYRLQLPRAHRLSLAARTRVYNYDQRDAGWILAPIRPDLSMLDSGQRGWGLSLSGEDTWQLSQPVSLILGLDTHVSEGMDRNVILVPRIGARKQGEQSTLQGWVLVRTDNLGSDSRQGGFIGRGATESETLGFRAEILQRFQGNWVVGGHVERNPLGASAILSQPGISDPSTPEVMLITDPSAWSQEAGFSVSKSLKGVEGSLESDHGRVVGRMAGGLTEAPVLVLEEGGVRYLAVKVTANVQKTDTQVRLDYTHLTETEVDETAGTALSASRVDVVILQPIPFVSNRGAGAWRILLGFQSLSRGPGSGTEPLENAMPEKINRFSGGVGVSF
ncbi:MAG: TonB-dependent receptor [Acidobacteria bacterium]|nr:TonB-dependent receptor [Acidobacteriota bacterium]